MLTEVTRTSIHFSDNHPKIPGFHPPLSCIRLKNKAVLFWQGSCFL